MADVQVFDFAEAEWQEGYNAPFCRVSGACHSKVAKLVNYSLWTMMGRLAAGASMRWSGPHGDEVVMPLTGSLTVDGVTVPALGSIVIEAGAKVEATASDETEFLHWGPTDPTPPADGLLGAAQARTSEARGVHLHGEMGKSHREMDFMDEQLDNMY